MKLNFAHCINNELICLQQNSAQILQISFQFRTFILFQLMHSLANFEKQFSNSIFFQYFQYRVGNLTLGK